MSVDDMLWWLYDQFKIVVGTRTIRRVFERKGEHANRFKKGKSDGPTALGVQGDDNDANDGSSPLPGNEHYQSPYAPMAAQQAQQAEMQLAQALQQETYPPPPAPMNANNTVHYDDNDDEEIMALELQQIALQKREVELKLRMRRLQQGRSPHTPGTRKGGTPQSAPSSLFNPNAATPASTGPKRDSRSKKKIEESKKRTAERQERMLRDLERRSRRREHLTAEWVQSKDIWPLRAQGMLADLMHQYGCYAFSQNNVDTFERMYKDLYQLVDLSKSDWDPHVHDEMLRERMKRKMGQLRTKMLKTGEIVGRPDGYGGYQKAENYTGQQAGADIGDDTEHEAQHDPMMQQMQAHDFKDQAGPGAAQAGPLQHHQEEHIQYELPEHAAQQMHAQQMPYGSAPMMHQHVQAPTQYPMMEQHQHNMLPYGQMPPQQGMPNQDHGMVM